MYDIFSEYKIAFLEETQEHLTLMNDDLIALEKDINNIQLINSIFRLLHTLKSSALAVGFPELGKLAHQSENLVQQIRNRQIKITPQIVNILFHVFDSIELYIQQAQKNQLNAGLFDDVLKKLSPFEGHKSKKKSNMKGSNISETANDIEIPKEVDAYLKANNDQVHVITVQIDPSEPLKWIRAELILKHAQKIGTILTSTPEKKNFRSDSFDGTFQLYLVSEQPLNIIKKKLTIDLMKINKIRKVSSPEEQESTSPAILDSKENNTGELASIKSIDTGNSIRVPVKKLDNIMHLVGELVVANSTLKIIEKKIHELHRDEPIANDLNLIVDKFAKLSTALQSRVLKTRMMPIHTLFNQYNRVVRDLALKEQKEVDLTIFGGETELDKKVIDAMGDPLTHLIRNAVNHGIELPKERIKKGKPRKAKIHLSAVHAGNHVVISIKDDGKGLDIEKIKNKAVEKGLLKPEFINELTSSEIINVIFAPGFSTAAKVSSVSGRGVGLDVVNNTINSLNGTIQVQTSKNKGTEFSITLPLTLAISTVIIAESGKGIYGIPIGDIRETVKISANQMENQKKFSVLNIDNRVVPVLGLDQIMDSASARLPIDIHGNVSIIIVSYRDQELGLIVDRILGKQEIVLKPLEEHYKAIKGISGAAILGDGTVILIADIMGILQIVRNLKEHEQKINYDIKEIIQS